MKKLSIILIVIATFFISCDKKETENSFNRNTTTTIDKQTKSLESGLENGVVYRFYTIIANTSLAYQTSIMMENDILKIAECKIEAIDIPEGNYTDPHIRFIGIPEGDVKYDGTSVEYTLEPNEICEIPIGFSENFLESKGCPGLPNIVNSSRTKKYFCSCLYDSGVSGRGKCNIKKSCVNSYLCNNCDCLLDARCFLKNKDLATGGVLGNIEFGVLNVKARSFRILIVEEL